MEDFNPKSKWIWKRDWCFYRNVSPYDTYWWERAEEEYQIAKSKHFLITELEEIKSEG